MSTNPTHAVEFHPGEFVRVGGGGTVWEVVEVNPHFLWLRSTSSGIRRSHHRALLRRCSADGTPIAEARPKSAPVTYTESVDGRVRINGETVRWPNEASEVVVEWEAPIVTSIDRDIPSVVELNHCTDSEWGSWLRVKAYGTGCDTVAFLTRRSTLELAARLTDMASRMNDHPDQRVAGAR